MGYNYGSGGSHNAFEGRFRQRANSIASSASTNGISSGINSGLSGYSTDPVSSGNVEPVVETEYNKEYFSYTAPEEEFNDLEGAQRLATIMRKNLRVLFIKTPENKGLTNAAFELAKQNAESKTAIYVLTKQSDVGELAHQLQNIQQSQSAKPEVHFVKYRTPEDAVRAQQIIQQEYDALGGPSRVSNEGVAPVLDFSSKKEEVTNNNAGSSASAYLPPKTRH